ncbi:hypothetical protein [Lysinibacillus xylanilyticus]|uniref:hypothetical protein n=1 Tax=Lysinibacillus xylanilyticus TaxID=582475 RepID=UPI003D048C97
MFKKIFTTIFALSLFGFLSMGTSYARDDLANSKLLDDAQVKVSITNDETGETKFLDPIILENNLKVRSFESDNESEVFGYDVFIPIENQNSLNITPYDIGGGSTTESGITARLYAEYILRSNNTEIKLNKVYGGWTTSHQMYGLSNRTVNAHSGSALGTSLPTKKPTSNSFNYTTGFGRNMFGGGDGSPRAWSSVKVSVTGMTSTSTVKLYVTFPNK